MEELLKKLRQLANDEVIKKHCGDRVFMNNKNTQVQMPYVSYNPVVSGKGLGHYGEGYAKHILDRYTCQVNFYCDSKYKFFEVYNAIRNVMQKEGFRADTEFIESTDSGDTWICFRYTIRI